MEDCRLNAFEEGWARIQGGEDLEADLAIDVVRALRLRDAGYKVWTKTIAAVITPKNRLLLGRPPSHTGAS